MQVEGVVFVKEKQPGDFKWMVAQPEYDDALFIVMENVIDSLSPNADDGGGTAAIRSKTWLHMSDADLAAGPPRAAGIPTGFSVRCGGFTTFDQGIVRQYIDLSFERILVLLNTYPTIKRIIYSADKVDPLKIGSGIFKPHADVVSYISSGLHALEKRVPSATLTLEQIYEQELKLVHVPVALNYTAYQQQVLARASRPSTSSGAGPSTTGMLGKRPMEAGNIRSFMRKM